MTKVLTFKIEIEGLENKIWRKIEITDRRTVADLAYSILASFHSLAYHLYNLQYMIRVSTKDFGYNPDNKTNQYHFMLYF